MIPKNSRYARIAPTRVRLRSGEEADLVTLRDVPPVPATFQAAPRVDDRLDHLAHRYYRDATRWWRICDAVDVLDPLDVVEPSVLLPIPPDAD